MSTADEEASISIPSIAFVTILGYLIYRYFFSSSQDGAGSSSSSSSSRSSTTPRFTAQQVDHVAQMFPQLNRRDIMWDLHRNRGSVQATTNRILSNGRLEPAPPTFQPPTLTVPASTVTAPSSTTKSSTSEPDLITRYNLQSRVSASDKGKGREEEQESSGGPGWASSREERQRVLKRRRDEMILAARRKMQERDAQGGGGGLAVADGSGAADS